RLLQPFTHVEADPRPVTRQLEGKRTLPAQILGEHALTGAEVLEHESRRCAVEEPEVHITQTVLEIGLALVLRQELRVGGPQLVGDGAIGGKDPGVLAARQPGLGYPAEAGGWWARLPLSIVPHAQLFGREHRVRMLHIGKRQSIDATLGVKDRESLAERIAR